MAVNLAYVLLAQENWLNYEKIFANIGALVIGAMLR